MIQIKLEKFEGPLGLLLQLIEKEELDITQISLAKIADQYVDYIKNSVQINPDEIADFLVVAAKLLLIKSRALLPYLYPEEEEEIEELEQQLKMYKEFLEAARQIEVILKKKKFMFARDPTRAGRQAILTNINLFSPPKSLTVNDLVMVFRDLLARVELPERLEEETLDYKVNIEDKILTIQQMLLNRIKIGFSKILASTKSKTEIIVSFLAMLELIKQKDVAVQQNGLFTEILISKVK